MLEKWRDL
ncbi:hypothetical protein LINPERPRIM_LOCUS26091 [Linum perenne]